MFEDLSITLAHGDGGGVTERFIRDEILTRFGHSILNPLEDGGKIVLDSADLVVSTDSYIVDPPVFPGGDIGQLAVSGTVNDLLACGARPAYLTFSLIISEGFPLTILRQILNSAQRTAGAVGMQVVTGDTKVLGQESNVGIVINTTGLGHPIRADKNYAVSNACVGDNIIVTGPLGDHGLAVLSAREGLGFEQRIQTDCAPLHELIIPLIETCDGVRCLRDPTRGGLIEALIHTAEASVVDILVQDEALPVKPEVSFGCEMLGLHPLSLVNEGKMIIVVAPEQTDQAITQLRRHPLGRESAVIGHVQPTLSSSGRLILIKEAVKRVVFRPEGQPLPRLC